MARLYVDPNLMRISGQQWSDHRDNQASSNYGVFAVYEDDKRQVRAQWHGNVGPNEDIPREFWEPYEVLYSNIVTEITTDGFTDKKVLQTSMSKDTGLSMKFTNVETMITYYRQVIAMYTELTQEEIIDTEFDTVPGYHGKIPKLEVKKEIEELEELLLMDEVDKPDTSVYGDGGW